MKPHIFAFFLLFVGTLHAQSNPHFFWLNGFCGGRYDNRHWEVLTYPGDVAKPFRGYNVRIGGELGIGREFGQGRWSLQTGLRYNYVRYFAEIDSRYGILYYLNINYSMLELPVLVEYKFQRWKHKGFYPKAGAGLLASFYPKLSDDGIPQQDYDGAYTLMRYNNLRKAATPFVKPYLALGIEKRWEHWAFQCQAVGSMPAFGGALIAGKIESILFPTSYNSVQQREERVAKFGVSDDAYLLSLGLRYYLSEK